MKFRTNKLSLKIALAGALLAASLPALAKTGDTDQPIHIELISSRWICRAMSSPSPVTWS